MWMIIFSDLVVQTQGRTMVTQNDQSSSYFIPRVCMLHRMTSLRLLILLYSKTAMLLLYDRASGRKKKEYAKDEKNSFNLHMIRHISSTHT
jgi:hypothetical protein